MTQTTAAAPTPDANITPPENPSAPPDPDPPRSGHPRGNPNLAPRCGAKARTTGCPCCAPAMPNGRRRRHGGSATGPRTPKGFADPAEARTGNTASTPPRPARFTATGGSSPPGPGRSSRCCSSGHVCRPSSRRGSRKDRTSWYHPPAPTRRRPRIIKTTPHATSHGPPKAETQPAGSWRARAPNQPGGKPSARPPGRNARCWRPGAPASSGRG